MDKISREGLSRIFHEAKKLSNLAHDTIGTWLEILKAANQADPKNLWMKIMAMKDEPEKIQEIARIIVGANGDSPEK